MRPVKFYPPCKRSSCLDAAAKMRARNNQKGMELFLHAASKIAPVTPAELDNVVTFSLRIREEAWAEVRDAV